MDATLGTASTDSGLLEGVGLPADDIRAWHAAGSALASTIAASPEPWMPPVRRRVST